MEQEILQCKEKREPGNRGVFLMSQSLKTKYTANSNSVTCEYISAATVIHYLSCFLLDVC